MTIQVLSHVELGIDGENDVSVVRKHARALALARGFDAFATAAITTATSELTRNAWVHARGGVAVLEEITDGTRFGVRAEFRDTGPGIADIKRVLEGGYSTARSMGLGLSGTRRLVDEFEIASKTGGGTQVKIVKWTRF